MKLSKTAINLLIVLILQLAVVGYINFQGSSLQAFSATDPLLQIDRGQVTLLKITNSKSENVTLEIKDGIWIVPEKFNFPADNQKISNLLDNVLSFKRGLPVGQSDASAKTFKVTEKEFERKIEFSLAGSKEPQAKIYFGTSPSFKQINVRLEDGPVYVQEFSVHNAGYEPTFWLNRDAIKLSRNDVKNISLKDLKIRALPAEKDQPMAFTLDNTDKTIDQSKLNDLVSDAIAPSFEDVISDKPADFTSLAKVLDWKVELNSGEIGFSIYGPLKEDKESFVLLSSKMPYAFKVKEPIFKNLKEATIDKLIKLEEQAEQPEAGK